MFYEIAVLREWYSASRLSVGISKMGTGMWREEVAGGASGGTGSTKDAARADFNWGGCTRGEALRIVG